MEVLVFVVKGLTQYSVQSFTQGVGDNCGGVQTSGADEQVDNDKIQWHEPDHRKHIKVGLQTTYWSLFYLFISMAFMFQRCHGLELQIHWTATLFRTNRSNRCKCGKVISQIIKEFCNLHNTFVSG